MLFTLNKPKRYAFSLCTLVSLTALPVMAHTGRNFSVEVVNDGAGGQMLRLQGYNTAGPEMGVDAQGRQYYGAVHDHFSFPISGGSFADKPGMHVDNSLTALQGESLSLQVTGAMKWTVDRSAILMDGSPMLKAGITASDIQFESLAIGETINVVSVGEPGQFTSTDALGQFLLEDAIAPGPLGYADIEITYDAGFQSPDTIYVIESVLKTSAAGIGDSEVFYTILSPDGTDMRERLHFPALLVEESLGTPVPEPMSLAVVGMLPLLMRRRRA